MKNRLTFAVRDRAAAREWAEFAATISARPVFWGQPHGATHTWLVNLKPCGSPEETVFLALPQGNARNRPTFLPQVYEAVLWLEDRAVRGSGEAAWSEELLRIRDHMVEKAGTTLEALQGRAHYAAVQAGVVNQKEEAGGRVRASKKSFGPADVPTSGALAAAWSAEED